MNDNPYAASPNAKLEAPRSEHSGSKIKRIKRFDPLQLGKVFGILYALMSLIFMPFLLLAALLGNSKEGALSSLFVMIFLPVIYGVAGFIFGIIGGFIYNICAKMVGGIEVEIE